MNSFATLVALLASAIPMELFEPAPGVLLRWPSLELVDERSGAPSGQLSPLTPLQFTVTGPALVRLRGAFSDGCEPRPSQRAGDGPGWIDLPLKAVRDGGDLLLQVTPAIAPGIGDEETDRPARFRVELPPGCQALNLSAYRAVAEEDEYGSLRLASELRRMADARPSEAEVRELLSRTMTHRWQETAALAMVLPTLLASLPGVGTAAEELSRAWMEDAVVEAQRDDIKFAFIYPLSPSLPTSSVPGTPQPFFRLEPGQVLDAEVGRGDILRLLARAPLDALQSNAVQRVEVQFDERPITYWHTASSRDPEVSGFARQRSLVVRVPPRAAHVRIRSAAPLLIRGLEVRHKVHLEDISSGGSSAAHLEQAVSLAAANARSTLVGAIARAQLGRPEDLQRRLDDRALVGAPAAIAALIAAETATDRTVAAGLLDRAEAALTSAKGDVENLARPALRARILRARMNGLVAIGRASEAVRRWEEFAAERPLTSEDAAMLAEVDAFASEGLEGGAPVLAILDGLAASRPLDREVLIARSRAYALATGWASLGTTVLGPESSFLEPMPGVPHPLSPERFAYARLPRPGEPLEVLIPLPSLPNRKPVLSFAVARGAALARLVSVKIDGKTKVLPALSSFDRFDVPVTPGKHQVSLDSSDFAGEVFVNFAMAPESQFLRRYSSLGPAGLEWRSREVGSAAVAGLALRLVGRPGAAPPDSLEVTLDGVGPQPAVLRVHPGPWRTNSTSDLPPGAVVSEPLEVSIPLTKANLFRLTARVPEGCQLLARLSLRRHRPLVPAVVDPEAVTGAGVAMADPGGALGAVATLSAKVASGRATPVTYIARAATLLELDELGLSREDLLTAIEERSLGPHQRALVSALWRNLDAIGSDHPASVPSDVEYLTPSLLVAEGHPEALSVGLFGLLDDAPALAQLAPGELRTRAGEGAAADLAEVVAATAAERAGNARRAADVWLHLAQAHPEMALLRRTAGEALLRSPDVSASALAYLHLSAACDLEPRDAYARRLLRRAAARTRLRPLRFADRSAGTRAVLLSGGEPQDPNIEEAMLPPTPDAQDSFLLTDGRQARLSLSLNAPLTVTLRARITELRPHEGLILGRAAPGVEVDRDGGPPVRLECSTEGNCRSAPIDLRSGMHSLQVRLTGGVHLAGRLWADVERGPGLRRGRTAQHVAATHLSEYLVATVGEPIELLVQGPALLRLEARSTFGRQAAPDAEVSARTGDRPPVSRAFALAAEVDPRATLAAGGDLTQATLTTLALPASSVYRVTLRPRAGELLARVAARDAAPTEEAAPEPSLVFLSLTPPPSLAAPGIQEPIAGHVEGDSAMPGFDAFGSLEARSRWAYQHFDESGPQVQAFQALDLSLAYRRLLDPGWFTLKVMGGVRVPTLGSPGEWMGAEAFFMHPELRALRAQLTVGGKTQQVGAGRLWAGAVGLMFEPVVTLTSAVHLVTKLGGRLGVLPPIGNPSDTVLATIDPAIYNRYAAKHPSALYLEELLQTEPLANLVVMAGARVTTNASMSPIDLDFFRAQLTARALFGHTEAEVNASLRYSFVDRDRTAPIVDPILGANITHTIWIGNRNHLEVGFAAAYNFRVGLPEFSIVLLWETSNGRRFRDHTPLEGEDYFFPQRGPGPEPTHLVMGR